MKTFKVTFEDGNSLVTDMNATIDEAINYYVDNGFELYETAGLIKAVAVEEL